MHVRAKCLDCWAIDYQCGTILFHDDGVAILMDGGGEILEFLHFIYKDIQSFGLEVRKNGYVCLPSM